MTILSFIYAILVMAFIIAAPADANAKVLLFLSAFFAVFGATLVDDEPIRQDLSRKED